MSLTFDRVKLIDKDKNKKAYAQGIRAFLDLVVNGVFMKGYRVLDHGNGLWVSPPTNRSTFEGRDGKERVGYHPICGFKNSDHNDLLHDDIIAKFKKIKAGEPVAEESKEPAEKPY